MNGPGNGHYVSDTDRIQQAKSDRRRCQKMEHDHDAVWFAEILEMRLLDMSPREKTINIKLSRGSAKLLAENLKRQAGHVCALPDSIQEALNSGDGTYRP